MMTSQEKHVVIKTFPKPGNLYTSLGVQDTNQNVGNSEKKDLSPRNIDIVLPDYKKLPSISSLDFMPKTLDIKDQDSIYYGSEIKYNKNNQPMTKKSCCVIF